MGIWTWAKKGQVIWEQQLPNQKLPGYVATTKNVHLLPALSIHWGPAGALLLSFSSSGTWAFEAHTWSYSILLEMSLITSAHITWQSKSQGHIEFNNVVKHDLLTGGNQVVVNSNTTDDNLLCKEIQS